MKRTLSTSEAAHELLNDKNASWSYAGAYALAEYLEEYEAGTGEELEFDPGAIRCEFSEYGSALEAAKDYGFEPDEAEEGEEPEDTEERNEGAAIEWLNDRTSVIPFDGGVIVQDF